MLVNKDYHKAPYCRDFRGA